MSALHPDPRLNATTTTGLPLSRCQRGRDFRSPPLKILCPRPITLIDRHAGDVARSCLNLRKRSYDLKVGRVWFHLDYLPILDFMLDHDDLAVDLNAGVQEPDLIQCILKLRTSHSILLLSNDWDRLLKFGFIFLKLGRTSFQLVHLLLQV